MTRNFYFQIGSFPITYHGLPPSKKLPESFSASLVDIFNKKLSGWKGSLLSQASKFQLIISTLQGLIAYALSFFKIPLIE